MNILILANKVGPSARSDQQDLLAQVNFVANILLKHGHNITKLFCDLNLFKLYNQLKTEKIDLVVNMVEELSGHDQFANFIPLILESLHLPYTGASSLTLMVTNNKVATKHVLMQHKLSTPEWFMLSTSDSKSFISDKYIIKSLSQHASYALDSSSIINTKSKNSLISAINQREKIYGCDFFAEKYIDGREFNVALIESSIKPEIMAISEIKFLNHEKKYKILTHNAKWATTSDEYISTIRTFDFQKSDKTLLQELTKMSLKTWQTMNLSGYARIDFRVDHNNKPYILEINTNPCLAPDGGFIAASQQKYNAPDVAVLKIIDAAFQRHRKWN